MEIDKVADEQQASPPKAAKLTEAQKFGFCAEWEKSGLSKANFCKSKNISIFAFKYWYYRSYLKRKNEGGLSQWAPVVAKLEEKNPSDQTLELELVLPHNLIVRTSLPSAGAVGFIQELFNAITVIR